MEKELILKAEIGFEQLKMRKALLISCGTLNAQAIL